MFAILIALRNFTIAILLAWLGFSIADHNEDSEDKAPQSLTSAGLSGFIR